MRPLVPDSITSPYPADLRTMQQTVSDCHSSPQAMAHAVASNDGWWNFDSTIAPSFRRTRSMTSLQASSSRGGPSCLPEFHIGEPQYCFPPQTDSKMNLIPFSPSFSPLELHAALDGDSNFPMNGVLGAGGSGYWIDHPDPRIFDHNPSLQSPQWSSILPHLRDPWAMSAFDVPDALPPYPPYEFMSPLPHTLPRASSPGAASADSGRLSPLSVFGSSDSSSRRSSIDAAAPKRCSHCSATATPLWRRNPATRLPLCNACGLYQNQRGKMRPLALIAADQDDDPEAGLAADAPACSHCHTRRTSVWRRSKSGAKLCNACGVFLRLRGRDRPLALHGNKIKPRCKHTK
ncbi:hypothetical protein DFH09DRAFT_401859 [Mycena vulgaris]|nr:hypothetical protein DFH09DRAFT_401859 [Mycena vulgaris]